MCFRVISLCALMAVCARLAGADTLSSRDPLYQENCAVCHGATGNGAGPSAGRLQGERPRDFREANFRFRSTASGELPLKEDLARTLRQGIALSAMPAFSGLFSAAQEEDLILGVTRFSLRWKEEGPGTLSTLPGRGAVPANSLTREKGRALFLLLRCVDCHGLSGKGDGLKSRNLKDSKGDPVLPRDFTLGKFKSGPDDRDILRAVMLGLDGTPMASFESSLTGSRAWYLLDYVRAFEEKEWFAKAFLQPVR
jgi:mono/diheme cytochrome c family protein